MQGSVKGRAQSKIPSFSRTITLKALSKKRHVVPLNTNTNFNILPTVHLNIFIS